MARTGHSWPGNVWRALLCWDEPNVSLVDFVHVVCGLINPWQRACRWAVSGPNRFNLRTHTVLGEHLFYVWHHNIHLIRIHADW